MGSDAAMRMVGTFGCHCKHAGVYDGVRCALQQNGLDRSCDCGPKPPESICPHCSQGSSSAGSTGSESLQRSSLQRRLGFADTSFRHRPSRERGSAHTFSPTTGRIAIGGGAVTHPFATKYHPNSSLRSGALQFANLAPQRRCLCSAATCAVGFPPFSLGLCSARHSCSITYFFSILSSLP